MSRRLPDTLGPDLRRLLEREYAVVTEVRRGSATPWDDWYEVGIRVGLETLARRVQVERNRRREVMRRHMRARRA